MSEFAFKGLGSAPAASAEEEAEDDKEIEDDPVFQPQRCVPSKASAVAAVMPQATAQASAQEDEDEEDEDADDVEPVPVPKKTTVIKKKIVAKK